jgi:hypothetical protein
VGSRGLTNTMELLPAGTTHNGSPGRKRGAVFAMNSMSPPNVATLRSIAASSAESQVSAPRPSRLFGRR